MNDRHIKTTRLYDKTDQSQEQIVINCGGAGSSKTYSFCQHFIFNRLLKIKKYKLLILRKVRHSCKLSVYKTFMDLLKEYGIYKLENDNRSDLFYNIPELDSQVRFAGLEDQDQIKSTDWHDIWLNEANEFSKSDLSFLKTRLFRGQMTQKDFKSRIYMDFNPIDCWIFDLEGQPDIKFIYSNYKDNPFANQDYIATLEALKDTDMTYYKIYALGERAIPTNIIYKPYKMDSTFPETFDETMYGMDFGFNSPSVLLEIGIKDNEYYERELLYQTKLNNQELIEQMKLLIPPEKRSYPIYPDSEDPSRIDEIYKAGFNVIPALKGKDSVKMGIDVVKRQTIHTLSINVNLNQEHAFYKWKEDKNGNVLDEPVKFKDHAKDAERYAIYTHSKVNSILIS